MSTGGGLDGRRSRGAAGAAATSATASASSERRRRVPDARMRAHQRRLYDVRIAIVSDIHGNRQAFEAVLDAIDDADCEELWCLGDLVGYGAEPDACVELAREHAAICLAGNHDLGVAATLPLDEFSRGARLAATWTQETITAARRRRTWQSLAPQRRGRGGRPLPRQPARPGLGVRALAAAGRAVLRRPGSDRSA